MIQRSIEFNKIIYLLYGCPKNTIILLTKHEYSLQTLFYGGVRDWSWRRAEKIKNICRQRQIPQIPLSATCAFPLVLAKRCDCELKSSAVHQEIHNIAMPQGNRLENIGFFHWIGTYYQWVKSGIVTKQK